MYMSCGRLPQVTFTRRTESTVTNVSEELGTGLISVGALLRYRSPCRRRMSTHSYFHHQEISYLLPLVVCICGGFTMYSTSAYSGVISTALAELGQFSQGVRKLTGRPHGCSQSDSWIVLGIEQKAAKLRSTTCGR